VGGSGPEVGGYKEGERSSSIIAVTIGGIFF